MRHRGAIYIENEALKMKLGKAKNLSNSNQESELRSMTSVMLSQLPTEELYALEGTTFSTNQTAMSSNLNVVGKFSLRPQRMKSNN